jgi:PAS domain S-box-containing protein
MDESVNNGTELGELLAREQRRAIQLKMLAEAALAINSAQSLDSAFQIITEKAREIIGAHMSITSLTISEDLKQSIQSISLSDKYTDWNKYAGKPEEIGVYMLVCRSNRSMRLTQAELLAHPEWHGFGKQTDKDPPLRGWLAAPLVQRNGRNLGIVQLSDKFEGEFTEDDESILVQLAQSGSVAIENVRLLEQLDNERRLLEAVLNQMPGGVVIAEAPSGKLILSNEQAEDIFRQPILPLKSTEEYIRFKLFHPDGRAFKIEDYPLYRSISNGEVIKDIEIKIVRGDGNSRDIRLTSTPIRDREGRIIAGVATFTDISEHRQLEEQVRLSQKIESIGRLAGGVAHDFNNILTAIIGFTDLSLRQLPADSPLTHNLKEIRQSADRATYLTRQLLAFARKQILEPKNINLNDVISNFAKFLRRVISEYIELELRYAAELDTVYADISQIEQVLMNLCVNASDAMPNGGKLSIETSNVFVDESFIRLHPWAKIGKYALISVHDTGTGMDSDTQQRIFEPFFTTKELGKGTGLGLAMVYGIVKQHEGMIHVYSEPGLGTAFRIYLPSVTGSTKDKVETVVETPRGGSETILLVEDEVALRDLIVITLEDEGYKILVASDGEDAMKVFEENKDHIDLILSDVVMPKLGGKDLYNILHGRNPELKFIFMSGYSARVLSERFIIEERLELLRKPFSPVELTGKIREVLDRK